MEKLRGPGKRAEQIGIGKCLQNIVHGNKLIGVSGIRNHHRQRDGVTDLGIGGIQLESGGKRAAG